MKNLFNEDDYTPEAHELVGEISRALSPIMEDWADKGYSLREIAYLASAEADMVSLSLLLDKRVERARERRKKPK